MNFSNTLRALFKNLGFLVSNAVESHQTLQEIKKQMDTFTADQARLDADVQANTDAIKAVATAIAEDTKSIADLTKQVADLKATGVNTAAMEATLTKLETNNTALSGLAPVKAVTPPVV